MNLCIQLIIPFNDPPIAALAEARTELEDRKGGFPHSEIAGSKGASASPALIAACHVLHRLSTPRHPSEALQRLIVSQQNSCVVAPPDWKDAGGPRLIFVRQCLLLEQDLEAPIQTRGSRSRSSFTISMSVGLAADDKPFAMRASGHSPLAVRRVVEPDGVEPTTSCLQSRRSTN